MSRKHSGSSGSGRLISMLLKGEHLQCLKFLSVFLLFLHDFYHSRILKISYVMKRQLLRTFFFEKQKKFETFFFPSISSVLFLSLLFLLDRANVTKEISETQECIVVKTLGIGGKMKSENFEKHFR
jgi:hypothetical protein